MHAYIGRVKKAASDGFTLLELLVAIGIFGILMAMAIPNFPRWVSEYRLKEAVRDLYSNIQLAKVAAIKQNSNCDITYSSDPDQYTVSLVNKTVRLNNYGNGIAFLGPNGETVTVATVTFNSRGLSNAGYAYLSSDTNNTYYRVGSLTSGVILLERWNGSSWE